MRIGVVLGNVVPQDGGGFTFVEDVVKTLANWTDGVSELSFVFFCDPRAVNHFKTLFPSTSDVIGVTRESFFPRAVTNARRWIPLLGRLWWKRTALEKKLIEHDVSIAWFVGGNGEVLDIPYLATIWDVQHRTHPWFPEVSAKGEWDGREVAFATYLRRASVVITGTKVGAEQLSKFYQVEPVRIAILPHPTPSFAIESAKLSHQQLPAELPASLEFFFYPAQYWAHKNHAGLIRAFSKLEVGAEKNVKLVFVGSDKGNRAYLEGVASCFGVADRVVFLGFVERAHLIALYQRAVALVYPSFSGPENLPPLEAFAMRCPVACADFPGAREQLGDAALYFDPASEQSMIEALRRMYSDRALRMSLVERGLARAEQWQCRNYVAGAIGAVEAFSSIRKAWGHVQ